MRSGAPHPHPAGPPFQTRSCKARTPGGPGPGAARRSPPAQAPASGGVWAGFLRLGARGHRAGSPAPECAPSLLPLRSPAGGPPGPGAATPTTRISGHRGAPGGVPSSAFSGSRDGSSAHSSSPQGARQGPERPNRFTRSFPAPGAATPTPSPRLPAAA